jgi:hypothetical protein
MQSRQLRRYNSRVHKTVPRGRGGGRDGKKEEEGERWGRNWVRRWNFGALLEIASEWSQASENWRLHYARSRTISQKLFCPPPPTARRPAISPAIFHARAAASVSRLGVPIKSRALTQATRNRFEGCNTRGDVMSNHTTLRGWARKREGGREKGQCQAWVCFAGRISHQ